MRKLSEQIGVQAPSTDYVKGRIVDNQTPINESINGDFVEFFHRMAWLAGITENGLPENTTNGHQLLQALKYLIELYSIIPQSNLKRKIINIGSWDMTSVTTKSVDHGLVFSEIRSVNAYIINDTGGYAKILLSGDGTSYPGGINITSNTIELTRGALFNSTEYNGTDNRGYVVIDYIE